MTAPAPGEILMSFVLRPWQLLFAILSRWVDRLQQKREV
jgi:hypothetical protein